MVRNAVPFMSLLLQQTELGLTAVFGPPASLPRFSEFFLKFVERVGIGRVVSLEGVAVGSQCGATSRVLIL